MPCPVAWSWMTEATRRGHRITLVNGARGRCNEVSLVATGTRPVGQGSGPARPAECRARPSAHGARMVSEAKPEPAHSCLEDGSTALLLRARARCTRALDWAGKCDQESGVPSTGDFPMTDMVGKNWGPGHLHLDRRRGQRREPQVRTARGQIHDLRYVRWVLSIGREHVTRSPVYRRPVTSR